MKNSYQYLVKHDYLSINMAEMLNLFDLPNKDFKVALTKMLQQTITNTLETNDRIRKFQQKSLNIKKIQINFELKKIQKLR